MEQKQNLDRFKFRAFRTVKGHGTQKMVKVDSFCGQYIKYHVGDESHKAELKYYTLMQCTGLKDKNGTLIYEGDIIDYNGKKWAVKHDLATFFIFNKYESSPITSYCAWKSADVCGNIYDNSDLLQVYKII